MLRYIHFSHSSKQVGDPSVICLGNFDGVHIGHAQLIRETIKMSNNSKNKRVRACAMCFSPMPSDFFFDSSVKHLMTIDEKIKTFETMGLDGVYICDFEKIYSLSPDEFMENIIIDSCNCVGVVCGFNYRFGYKASGKPEDLRDRFSDFSEGGFKLIDPITFNSIPVSSSAIKSMIECGDIATANKMLGRPFATSHIVAHGKNLGSKLGFPTINGSFTQKNVIPSYGIYITATELKGKRYKSITNVGVRPTINDGKSVTCETHIIDCDKNCDFYGLRAAVYFFEKIRDEKRFASIEQLREAIAIDVETAKNFFDKNMEILNFDA